MKNNIQTEKILNSIENSSKAQASEAFLLKMEQLAVQYVKISNKISWQSLIGIAASLLLLISINITMMKKMSVDKSESINPSIENYNLIPTTNLYHE